MKCINKLMKWLALMMLTVALFTSGCKKSDYHQLSDSDMTWLVYDNNEVDVFTNGTQTVSYYVTLRTKSYSKSDDTYNEYTGANFVQLHDTTAYSSEDSEGGLGLFKQDDESLLVTLTWPHFPMQDLPINNLPVTVETINGIIYDDIIFVDVTGGTDVRFYISKFWYSISEGMMQYEDMYGETWVKQ